MPAGKIDKNYTKSFFQSAHSLQFPTRLINKVTRKYLNLNFDKRPLENTTEVKTDARFFKLPYIGKYSNIVQKKIKNLAKNFCKGVDVKVVLTQFKMSNKFSYKDHYHLIFDHKFFTNLFVQNCYVGETTRHFITRINEHLQKKLRPTTLNICKNRVHVIMCAIRIIFQ